LALHFGISKQSTADNGNSLVVEVSADGGATWTASSFATLATGSGTGDGNWTRLKMTNLVPQSTALSIRFTNTSSSVYYRIDDIGICFGDPAVASISPTSPPVTCGTVILTASPGGDTQFQWSSGANSMSAAITSSGSYTVTLTDLLNCTASAGPVNVTITTPVTPSVSIANANSTVCTGVANTFTATPVNGGTPAYVWKVNGTSVGAPNAATYSPAANTLANGDIVTVEMTATGCVSPSTVISNPLTAQKFAYGPVTSVWTEGFGTSDVSMNSYNSTANPTLTFTASGNPLPDIRTSTVSPGGGANVYMGASGFLTRTWTISGINTTNAFPNKLSFNIYNPSSSTLTNTSFWLEVSTDGTNFSEVDYGSIAGPQGWKLVSVDNALPKSSTVWLRFNSNVQGATKICFYYIKL
jgi:hypothetical protein